MDVWILGANGPDAGGDDVSASEAPDILEVDMNTCNPASADLDEAYGCGMSKYIAEHPGEDVSDLLTLLPRWMIKVYQRLPGSRIPETRDMSPGFGIA